LPQRVGRGQRAIPTAAASMFVSFHARPIRRVGDPDGIPGSRSLIALSAADAFAMCYRGRVLEPELESEELFLFSGTQNELVQK
jgi:hypothetical protein